MEQRGINLAVSLSHRARDLREQLSSSPRRSEDNLRFDDDADRTPEHIAMETFDCLFAPHLRFSAFFLSKGEKDDNDFDVSPKSENYPGLS